MEAQDSFTVDGIKLDPSNKEFKDALDYIQYTNQLVYLTGRAGTGKTTFLKYLRKVIAKKMVVLAPTGVAAVNAQGQTIHSFFNIPISLFVPHDPRLNRDFHSTFRYKEDKIQIIRNLELLVIDEVSMVRCDILDVVDIILRTVRNRQDQPFGGVQVLLIGDTFQLPPVVTREDWSLLNHSYDSEFFFASKVIERVKPVYIELKKVYRQKEKEFIDLLNRVRVGEQEPSDIELLNSRVKEDADFVEEKKQIILTTTNEVAKNENKKKLQELPSASHSYEAEISGDFPATNYPTSAKLVLKVGAQVMFIKNNWEQGYFNGKIGEVAKLGKDRIVVNITDEHGEMLPIEVEPYTWENIVYSWDAKERKIQQKVTGTFKQYPLKLAWAITVHKSQGMTFEKVVADIGHSFAAGQVYVALSRCTSINGLTLKSKITSRSIRTDPRVIEFAKNEVPETLMLEQLQTGKADHYYAEARKCLRVGDPESAYDQFLKAIGYRNDIETGLFKRYFCTWFHWFHHGVKLLGDKNEELRQKNKNLRVEEVVMRKKITESESLLHEKKSEIEELKLTVAECQKDQAKLKATLSSKEEKIKELRREQTKMKKTIASMNDEKDKLLEEIERQKNIKWYQKLFGKK